MPAWVQFASHSLGRDIPERNTLTTTARELELIICDVTLYQKGEMRCSPPVTPLVEDDAVIKVEFENRQAYNAFSAAVHDDPERGGMHERV
jgi:hypothetical protein